MFRMPKFTIAGLLWLTVAVALGFAISQGPAPEPVDYFVFDFAHDTRGQEGFEASGCLLLLIVLVKHWRQLRSVSMASHTSERFAIQLRAWTCLILTFSIGSLLGLRLLLNRRLLSLEENSDVLAIWTSMVPDVLLTISALAALRLFLLPRKPAMLPGTKQALLNLMVIAGGVFFAVWMLTDQVVITTLVNIAIHGVEVAQLGRWHREGVFPNPLEEGFYSFWMAIGGTMLTVVGICLLLHDAKYAQSQWRWLKRIAFVVIILLLGFHAWWFQVIEFPRLNPDMASAGAARLWPDTIAGFLLALALAGWVAKATACDTTAVAAEIPQEAFYLGAAAAMLFISQLWSLVDSYLLLYSMISVYQAATLASAFEWLAGMIVMPDALLGLLLLASAMALLRQRFRRHDALLPIPAVSPSEFAFQFVAWSALIAVGVPALWAFSFCYWLGPFVLWW
jgi:hypothetical protein